MNKVTDRRLISGEMASLSAFNGSTPSTSTMKIREELLTCRLCSLQFRMFGRRPLALKCMHTFCEDCLMKRLATENGDHEKTKGWFAKKSILQLTCPVCESKTSVGKDISACRSLPVNPSVMELLEIMERRGSKPNGCKESVIAKNPAAVDCHVISQIPTQQQQSINNSVMIVNGNASVTTNGKQAQAGEQPSCTKVGSRSAAVPVVVSNDANNGRRKKAPPISSTIDTDAGSSQNLVSMVSIGTVGASRATATPEQHNSHRDCSGTKASVAPSAGLIVTSMSNLHQASVSSSVQVGAPLATSAYHQQSTGIDERVENHQPADAATVNPPTVQICSQCHLNPASVTVASAAKMTSLRLCFDCAQTNLTVVKQQGSRSFAPETKLHPTSAPDRTELAGGQSNSDKTREQNCEGVDKIKTPAVKSTNENDNLRNRQQQKASQIFVGGGKKAKQITPVSGDRRQDNSVAETIPSGAAEAVKNNQSVIDSEPSQMDDCRNQLRQVHLKETERNRSNESVTANTRNEARNNVETRTASLSNQHRTSSSPESRNTCDTVNGRLSLQRDSGRPSAQDTRAREKHAEAMSCDECLRTSFEPVAPQIGDIHPPPCENPPYNPSYDFINSSSTWQPRAGHNVQNVYNHHSGSVMISMPLSPPPSFQEKGPIPPNFAHSSGQLNGIPGRSVGLSFAVPAISSGFPAQPPKYEEAVMSGGGPPPFAASPIGYHSGGCEPSAPGATLRMPTHVNAQPSQNQTNRNFDGIFHLVRAFGKYSEITTQPTGFRAPTRISTSFTHDSTAVSAGGNSYGPRIIVTDRANSTIQIFTSIGECLSMLHVAEVNGCCTWTDDRRLVAATDRGVEVFDINGTRLDTIPLGPTVNVIRYQTGFIAVQSKSLSIFKGPTAILSCTVTAKIKLGSNRMQPFDEICDATVNNQQDIIVLESIGGVTTAVVILTEDGSIKSTISLSGSLRLPVAIAVDQGHNIFISTNNADDGGRVIMFSPDGREISSFDTTGSGSRVESNGNRRLAAGRTSKSWPAGIAIGAFGHLYTVIRGDEFAEIREYAYN